MRDRHASWSVNSSENLTWNRFSQQRNRLAPEQLMSSRKVRQGKAKRVRSWHNDVSELSICLLGEGSSPIFIRNLKYIGVWLAAKIFSPLSIKYYGFLVIVIFLCQCGLCTRVIWPNLVFSCKDLALLNPTPLLLHDTFWEPVFPTVSKDFSHFEVWHKNSAKLSLTSIRSFKR